jgi:hypothetical protein
MGWLASILDEIVGAWELIVRAPLGPSAGFRFLWLPAVSVLILLVFAFFKRGRYSFAWYLSFSAPGIIFFPLVVIDWASDPSPIQVHVLGTAVVVLSILYPVSWICPVVFFRQLWNIRARRFAPVSGWTVLGCLLIIVLYLWSDVFLVIDQAELK